MLFFPKGCPRCKGDMIPRCDIYGDYLSCLYCGHGIFLKSGNGDFAEVAEIISEKPEPIERIRKTCEVCNEPFEAKVDHNGVSRRTCKRECLVKLQSKTNRWLVVS